jgi:hypothetical protein
MCHGLLVFRCRPIHLDYIFGTVKPLRKKWPYQKTRADMQRAVVKQHMSRLTSRYSFIRFIDSRHYTIQYITKSITYFSCTSYLPWSTPQRDLSRSGSIRANEAAGEGVTTPRASRFWRPPRTEPYRPPPPHILSRVRSTRVGDLTSDSKPMPPQRQSQPKFNVPRLLRLLPSNLRKSNALRLRFPPRLQPVS